ncbi:MAG: energy transducer TonB [Bryobacteraceae bacterium]
MLASTVFAFPEGNRPHYETDSGTVGFLHYHLKSGGDILYPYEAAHLKQEGSGFFLMRLRPDGSVESLTMKSSTGHSLLDDSIMRTLKGYRFRPKTKGPLLWLVGFMQPSTVIVKLTLIKEDHPAPPHPKKSREP